MAFDIFQEAQGTTYPQDTVDIYTDKETAYQIIKLEEKLNSASVDVDPTAIEKEQAKLRKKLNASKAIIHLRGVPSDRIEEARDKLDKEFGEDSNNRAKADTYNAKILAMHWQYAENIKGEKDERKFSDDEMFAFLRNIPDESRIRLIRKVMDLSMDATYFEQVERSADFS